MFPNRDVGIAYAVAGEHQDRRASSGVEDMEAGGFVIVDGIVHRRGGADAFEYLPLTLNDEVGFATTMPFRCVYRE